MKSVSLTVAAALVAALGACTTPEQQADFAARRQGELNKALAGRVAGAPQDCIGTLSAGSGNSVTVVGDSVLYRDGRRIWRSQVADRCPALGTDQIVVTVQYGSQLCRNDRFSLINRGQSIPSAPCFFNEWVPYERTE